MLQECCSQGELVAVSSQTSQDLGLTDPLAELCTQKRPRATHTQTLTSPPPRPRLFSPSLLMPQALPCYFPPTSSLITNIGFVGNSGRPSLTSCSKQGKQSDRTKLLFSQILETSKDEDHTAPLRPTSASVGTALPCLTSGSPSYAPAPYPKRWCQWGLQVLFSFMG